MALGTFRVPAPLFFFQLSSTPTFLVLGVVGMGCPSSPGKKPIVFIFGVEGFVSAMRV